MLLRTDQAWRVVLMTLIAFSVNAAAAPLPPSPVHPPGNQEDFELLTIPQTPTAPPSLVQDTPADPFHCERHFVYLGKSLDCDSNVRRDGENLRPIMKDVPDAVAQLDAYQRSRRNLRYSAYAVSGALLIGIIGYFIARSTGGLRSSTDVTNADGSTTTTMSINPAYLVTLGALAVASGTFIYGASMYRANESHLTAAVSTFNQARPSTPIELEFKTGIHF